MIPMKKAIIIFGMITVFTGCSMAAMRHKETTPTAVMELEHMEKREGKSAAEPGFVDISIDCGKSRLGAYHVELHYNPEVVAVSEIERAARQVFAGNPMTKPQSYRSGVTRIIGLAPGGTIKSGRITIARVHFTSLAQGVSRLSVSIKSLYDPDSKPITGVAILSADEITVEQ